MRYKPLLLDVGGLDACCTDHALETLAKAISGEEGDSHDMWEPHHSPFVFRLIELFSKRGLMRIQKVQDELNAWLDGHRHTPAHAPVAKPAGMMQRWTEDELSLVRLYLESLPRAAFTLSDWGLLIDYLVQRYLPADALRTEAEWLATRSSIMGKVQANFDGKVTVAAADALIKAMPLTVGAAQSAFHFGATMDAAMEFGMLRCAELIVELSAGMRARLKKAILEHQFKVMENDHQATRESLQQKLFDAFGQANRDWRRIAITEAGEMCNQGMIASLSPGSRVRRIEQYKGACPFCKKIDGKVMRVVSPDDPKKNGNTDVWVGKNNVGRSSAPRKRVGDALIERLPSELWWIPAGTVHPHCRGVWHKMLESVPIDDPQFQAWLDEHLHKVKLR